MADGDIILGPNQYGKAENRLVRITRAPSNSGQSSTPPDSGESSTPPDSGESSTDVHQIEDLNVTSQLRGDFTVCHTEGDNSQVVTTDTQKNTVYAFARQHGVHSPEQFLLTLADHFVSEFAWVTGGRWESESYAWERILAGGAEHDHAFMRTGREVRTSVVQRDGDAVHVVSGFTDCTVLKSTGSEFHGFPRDRYTTLPEVDDRILATSVTAWWRYATPDVEDFNATYDAVKALMLQTFAITHSLALQQTIFAMGRAVLETFPEIAEIKLSCPNKHHFLVDLEPFGLDNPGEVFLAADRPYGLIEATVAREGTPAAPRAWETAI